MPAGEIAAADIENLPFTNQLLHRLPDFFPGRVPIDMMHLVEIDVLGAQIGRGQRHEAVGGKVHVVQPVDCHRALCGDVDSLGLDRVRGLDVHALGQVDGGEEDPLSAMKRMAGLPVLIQMTADDNDIEE